MKYILLLLAISNIQTEEAVAFDKETIKYDNKYAEHFMKLYKVNNGSDIFELIEEELELSDKKKIALLQHNDKYVEKEFLKLYYYIYYRLYASTGRVEYYVKVGFPADAYRFMEEYIQWKQSEAIREKYDKIKVDLWPAPVVEQLEVDVEELTEEEKL